MKINLSEITIRNTILPGDLGYIIYLHGSIYGRENNYGVEFEMYVAEGISGFYKNYNPEKDRVWICEHNKTIIGFLLLMHRENNSAQLRYFLLLPEYRGIGLGKKLMQLYIDFLHERGYQSSYLWTAEEHRSAAALYAKFGFRLTEQKESIAFGKQTIEQKYELKVTK